MGTLYTEEELVEFRDKMRKYKEVGAKQVLDIVKKLATAQINTAQLQQTKIANTIQSLSTMAGLENEEEGDEIKQLCLSLIKEWKKVVANEKLSKESSSKSSQQSSNGGNSKNSHSQEDHPKLTKSTSYGSFSNCEVIPYEVPQYKDDNKGQLPTFKSDTRTKALLGISNILSKVKSKIKIQQIEWIDIIVQIELGIYNRTSDTITYKTNVREVLGMFSSEEIIFEVISRLINKELTFKEVAEAKSTVFLTQKQLAANKKSQEDKLAVSDPDFYNNIRRQRLQGIEGEPCRVCKKKTAFLIKELQTRASDEPMTRFMECNSCGRSWRD